MYKNIRLILLIFGIVIFACFVYFTLNSANHAGEIELIHYTEFDGEVFTENWCTSELSCYGLDNDGKKIILDCSDMVMHGCFEGNIDDYEELKP